MATKFLADDKATFGKRALLWGDPVEILAAPANGHVRVRAHGSEGDLPTSVNLVDSLPLLEVYVIDVGQGDGILVHTPDDKWHLVDGGPPRSAGMLKKGAPNFLGWKFARELRRTVAEFENVVVSHSDLDHYGGIVDVLESSFGPVPAGEQPLTSKVDKLWHSGVPRFKGGIGRAPGATHLTTLLTDKASFASPPQPFSEDFARLAAAVQKAGSVERLTRTEHAFLPGYEKSSDPSRVSIEVLGPLLEPQGLRWLGSDSVTTNGHSIVLRLDYGKARILLTGDVNTKTQKLLLDAVPRTRFAADVVKGCHHGAEDVLPDFFKAMKPRATVISSGDNEGHTHPRPAAVGAYGRAGRPSQEETSGDELPPLVYMTEIARSVRLSEVGGVRVASKATPVANVEVKPSSGAFTALGATPIATDLVYGLVNVRTDGTRILCATRVEGKATFDVKVFMAGVTP
jgi:beta-lactamase superfamily II metal-dependent hydrolase